MPRFAKGRLGDVDRIVSVRGVQRSPDGVWVAYTAGTVDVAKDKTVADIWMVRWGGSERVRLTSSDEAESAPRWSPDGRWLSFVRPDEKKKPQVWTLSRLGGEAQSSLTSPAACPTTNGRPTARASRSHRLEQGVAWFDKYVKGGASTPATATATVSAR